MTEETKGRVVTGWEERDFVRNRSNIWFGEDMPKTVSAKEIIDNGLDQIADKKTKAKSVFIKLTRNSVLVIDDGAGISTVKNEDSGKTNLFLAVAKLYTSTNYEGTESLTGNNGVGATATNFLSKRFVAGHLNKDIIKGYEFEEGSHKNDGEELDTIKVKPNKYISKGFYVSAEYQYDILDESINVKFLLDYIKFRTGELPEGANVYVEYDTKDLTLVEKYRMGSNLAKDTLERRGVDLTKLDEAVIEESEDETEEAVSGEMHISKDKDSENYVPSWEERAIERGLSIVRMRNGFKYAFGKEQSQLEGFKNIVQGAPVDNPLAFRAGFTVGDFKANITVPYTFLYSAKQAPKYTDQTKVKIKIFLQPIMDAFKRSDLYSYFNKKAEEQFLESQLKNNSTESYTPATGGPSVAKELIIAEGYSAVSAIKAVRDPKTQACFFIRGTILNVYKKDLNGAMGSPVVKELLTVLQKEQFDKVIIAVDADVHGSHIFNLVMGLFYKFQYHYIEQGRLFYLNTPFYLFKNGKEFKWSDDKNDCPRGWHIKTNKGLGGLTQQETKKFIIDRDTRELWRINDDKDSEDSLYLSMKECGARWIIEE